MKRRIRTGLLLLLALCLLSSAAPAEDAAPSVRIRLRRLGITDRAELYLDGSYTLETSAGLSAAFDPGTHLTAQVNGGQIVLYAGTVNLTAGNGARFVQHEPASGGLRFRKGGGRYPGSLLMEAAGGQLVLTLTLSVEDYLQGVVPYEMSNDFPLEALKAQAICARTYALAHLNPDRDYDMVDTTANQVFMGIDSSHVNAIRAVQETAGVVSTVNGQLAVCYYAASNGGQTVLPGAVWPGESNAGYAVTDDPYDLANPESPVLKRTLNRDGSGLRDGFTALLRASVADAMKKLSMPDSADAFRVDAILGVTAEGAAEGSRLQTKLRVRFRWSGRPVTATPDPGAADGKPSLGPWQSAGEHEAVLAIFPDVIGALDLSIGGLGNELITVTEKDSGFTVAARRYGHGVGMSQRGAQWMAAHEGKTYADILAFYYPGTVLQRAPFGPPALPTMLPALAQTPAPAASPTPRPTLMPVTADLPEGAWLASVEGIDADSSLNLRAEPSTAGDILMRLYKHQWLIVLNDCEEEGWVHVQTDTADGYVMVSFLEKIAE